jgi:inner membrane transporter RhtA
VSAYEVGVPAPVPEPKATVVSTHPSPGSGALLALCSMSLVQLGAALSPPLFERAGVAGVTWLRLAFGALLLLVWARPRIRGRAPRDLWGAVALGVASAAMTLAFMLAIDRVPLGVVVTIEFLGPLTVALVGARRLRDGIWVALAGGGVALLTLGHGAGGSLDALGLLLAAAAGTGWGCYILLTRHVGRAWTGVQGLAVAMAVAAVVSAPVGIADGGSRLASPHVLIACIGLAVLLPVLPYSLEMAALRRLPASSFGVLMSLEPGIGALLGFLVLGQDLAATGVIAIAMVIAASAGATATVSNADGSG